MYTSRRLQSLKTTTYRYLKLVQIVMTIQLINKQWFLFRAPNINMRPQMIPKNASKTAYLITGPRHTSFNQIYIWINHSITRFINKNKVFGHFECWLSFTRSKINPTNSWGKSCQVYNFLICERNWYFSELPITLSSHSLLYSSSKYPTPLAYLTMLRIVAMAVMTSSMMPMMTTDFCKERPQQELKQGRPPHILMIWFKGITFSLKTIWISEKEYTKCHVRFLKTTSKSLK